MLVTVGAFLGRGSLEAHLGLPGGVGVRPSGRQSIAGVPGLLVEGGWESIVVLAIDGLGYDLAEEVFQPDRLVPMTTTFPSTSITAWMTALTGRTASEHGLLGVRFRAPDADRLLDCFADEPPHARRLPPVVFQTLAAHGVRCLVNPGEMATWPGWWRSAVTRGATELRPTADWDCIRYDPARTAQAAEDEVRNGLRQRGAGPSVVWSWINVDDCVHRLGYPPELVAALRRLGRLAAELAEAGHTVLAFSDHGLVPSSCPPALMAGWEAATGPGLCRLPNGGAGRTRWCYPEPGRTAEVAERLADLFGDRALVVPVRRLAELGLLDVNEETAWALGDVVCLAIGEEFAVPDPGVRYEHGSVTAQEMIVPLAVWEAR